MKSIWARSFITCKFEDSISHFLYLKLFFQPQSIFFSNVCEVEVIESWFVPIFKGIQGLEVLYDVSSDSFPIIQSCLSIIQSTDFIAPELSRCHAIEKFSIFVSIFQPAKSQSLLLLDLFLSHFLLKHLFQLKSPTHLIRRQLVRFFPIFNCLKLFKDFRFNCFNFSKGTFDPFFYFRFHISKSQRASMAWETFDMQIDPPVFYQPFKIVSF